MQNSERIGDKRGIMQAGKKNHPSEPARILVLRIFWWPCEGPDEMRADDPTGGVDGGYDEHELTPVKFQGVSSSVRRGQGSLYTYVYGRMAKAKEQSV